MSTNKTLEEQGIAANDSSSKFIGVSLVFHALLVLLIVYLNFPAIKQKFNPEPESVAVEIKEPDTTTTAAEVRKPAEVPAPVVEPAAEPVAPVEKEKPIVKAPAAKPIVTDNKEIVKDIKKKAKLRMEEFKDEEELTTTNIRTVASANNKPVASAKPVAKKTSTKKVVAKSVSAKSTSSSANSTSSSVSKKSNSAVPTENESEVLVPKATITEISETEVGDDGIPLPEIVDAEIPPMESSVTNDTVQSSRAGNSSSATGGSSASSSNLQEMARSELFEETVEENNSSTVVRSAPPTIVRPSPEQIRAVANLRQRPGNPLPAYSDFERLRRHEGQVTYLAYVNADGSLRDFILSESSGHTNLDQKTLSALKGWRFYPGQQGWVEIPQIWVLSGQPEELPSQLRR